MSSVTVGRCELEAPFVLRASREAQSWSVECPDMPSLFAGGDSYEEARALAVQAIRDVHGPATTCLIVKGAPQ